MEADVPEFLIQLRLSPEARKLDHAIGDLKMIAFYYLLRIGKYTTKGTHNNSNMGYHLLCKGCCLSQDASADLIAEVDGVTMKLDNQKNGWKGVCVYQDENVDPINCPVRALGR